MPMPSQDTSVSLLERLRHQPRDTDWQQLVELYTPLIQKWLHRQNTAAEDVDDIVQDVMAVLLRKLPDFQHNRRAGAFRHWLRTTTVNCLRDSRRARQHQSPPGAADDLQELEDPTSALSRAWDREHDEHVLSRMLELIKPRFTSATWQAFEETVQKNQPAQEVAQRLGMSVNAVLIAKSRVLQGVRLEVQGLTDL